MSDLDAKRRQFAVAASDATSLSTAEYWDLKKREAKSDYRVFDFGPSWGFTFLGFNMNPKARLAAEKVKLFCNLYFRRAVSHAINRAAIVKDIYGGQAQSLYGPLTPVDKVFYNPQIPRYEYNPTQARQLLRAAGLRDNNRNGLLELNGRDLSINLITNIENNLRRRISEQIVRDLRKVGIGIKFTPVAFNQLVTRLDSPPYQWEAVVLGFTGGPEPHEGANIWMSSGNLHMWNPLQRTPATPWEVQGDDLLRQGARTLDEAERRRIYKRWQVLIAQQQPFTFLVAPHEMRAIRKKFGNVTQPVGGGAAWNVEELYDRTATRNTT